ncbi:MAG: prephenate dehydrogenase/arogenate dehydrogenase family protein [Terrimicrobiaceae bacterium]|nr:prephenate dehydrogenase/arogenate dehydrogenase family protein [Terrimicrobiaceae bacterium]
MPLHQQDFPGSLRALAIVGPGLIGGSLAMAAERAGVPDVRVWSRASSLARVRQRLPRASSDLGEVVEGAELVVLCTPASAMAELALGIRARLAPDALVTDAASTKVKVCALLGGIFGGAFAGSHPMAGSEQSGIEAADPGLFDGALCIVVPGEVEQTAARIEAFWKMAGCRTLRMDAAAHDRLLARASHLPHAVAAGLALAVAERCPGALEVAAGGFRDTTRIAAGPPAMWAGIFMDNREALLAAIGEFEEAFGCLRQALEAGDAGAVESFLKRAAAGRAALP